MSLTPSNKKDVAKLAQLEKQIPKLNGVIPAGVSKPKSGKKKGKVFVDDKETMLEILKMVNDAKEVKIEEKLDKGRQLEALREQRRREQDEREMAKKRKLVGLFFFFFFFPSLTSPRMAGD